ncbi:DgaE family pyridoxal phosphate-dependent ammonia lyase [Bacillus sp. 1P06AnD]|uniref:DgaE family pyridoxal phosphate-dependent ammonia lyase n=1 Tax=Bacillus sp. 1P06AnD TaxID=3132208 RepID=UPI0039A381C4
MGIFKEMGLRQVINASGKMTALGATAVNDVIAEALKNGAQEYVIMDELMVKAGEDIAGHTGAEDGCPTGGAAAGIAISVAAVIAGEDLSLIERLPASEGLKNEIIIQKGHLIHFGGNIGQMITLGGGMVKEVGCANEVLLEHIEGAINERTAALFYVKSHHAIQKGMVAVEKMLEIAERHQLPLIVDGAAESDFRQFTEMGVPIAIYSGGKALGGPTCGFISGDSRYMEACRKQYKGIGRAMKVGKEDIAALLMALDHYDEQGMPEDEQKKKMESLCMKLENVPGIAARLIQDEAGRPIYRAELTIEADTAGISAKEIAKKLEAGNPAIFLRNYYANVGRMQVDPRPLLPGQEYQIVERIIEIVGTGEKNGRS